MKVLKSYKYSFAKLLASLVFLSFCICPNLLMAQQSFDDGMNLYRQGNYSEAVSIFDNLDTDKARLFSGKSYFGLGKYLAAKTYLSQLTEESPQDLFLEAEYTLALTDFQLGLFGDALNRLYPMKHQSVKTQVVTDGIQFYEDILNYLTINQRKNAFQEAKYPEIKYDLVEAVFGSINYGDARNLYQQLKHSRIDTNSSAMQELSKALSDSMSYAVQMAYNNRFRAPDGITYNIGAALPSYSSDDPNFKVSQGLYFGYVLAAEQFNQQHPDKKAFIRYKNTGADRDSAGYAMTDLAWNYNASAVLGPLFSEPMRRMTTLAEQYQIPLIAPLANQDSLNIDNPYVYQANPTFTSHGRKMAQYAVNSLKMDTLAVLAEKGSDGEESAFAFRREAEKLGAKVEYFFVEDLASEGYELTDYTKYFTTDSAKIDTLGNYHYLDGIYAPFAGQAAPTLIELLLVDLEAMNSNLTVLGSQSWGNVQIPEERRGNRNIYFSESYFINQKSQRVDLFREEYKQRFDIEPNRFAMIGYDVASFVLETLNRIENPALLKNAMKEQPIYEGLISNISFQGTHINQEVKIFQITDQGVQATLRQ